MPGQNGNTSINACGSRLVSLIPCLIDEGKGISSPTQVEHSFTVLQYANLQLSKAELRSRFSDHAREHCVTQSHNPGQLSESWK